MIKVKNLNYIFKNGKGLKDINLELEKGYIYALIGPNGAGKTTLLNNLTGVYKSNGEIEVLGNNDSSKFFRQISYFQDSKVDTLNLVTILVKAYEDVEDFNKEFFYKKIEEYKIRLHEDVIGLMSKRKLSKGLSKILKIIFELSFDRKIYVLDEPLSNLDLLNKELILDMILEKSNEDTLIIISSHELNSIDSKIDKVILLDKSTVIEVASLDEIKNKEHISLSEYFIKSFKEGENND